MNYLIENFNDEAFIDENDESDTLNEAEISTVYNFAPETHQRLCMEFLSNSLKLNLEQLYIEVFKEISYSIDDDRLKNVIIDFAKDVFEIDETFHKIVLQTVKKEVSKFTLNIEIVKAEMLKNKINEINSHNQFCTLYLLSDPQKKFYTSFGNGTLLSVWRENFSLPLKNDHHDKLFLEVWNFIVDEKNDLNSVKSGPINIMKKIFKNIVVTSKSNQNDKKLIGRIEIPLETCNKNKYPTGVWYPLKNDKDMLRGRLLLKLSFDKGKSKQVSTQEHRHLLRVLLNYQIQRDNIQINSWMGKFLVESDVIIKKHIAYCNINSKEEDLNKWIEFIEIHLQSPVINYKVFLDILNKLMEPITEGQLSYDELIAFWQSAKKLLPFCYNVVRKIRKTLPEDEQLLLSQIECILNILQNLQSLMHITKYLDLFTPDMYDSLLQFNHIANIRSTLQDISIQAAQDWSEKILDNNRPSHGAEKEELEYQLKIIQFFELDLLKTVKFHNKLFVEKMKFPYAKTIFFVYYGQITEKCEDFVKCVFMNLESILFNKIEQIKIDDELLTVGKLLFTLYTEIQKFVEFGINNVDISYDKSDLKKYHQWFEKGVLIWLKIITYKAMQRIEIAVELDELVKVDPLSAISSSAVDTLTVINETNYFWQQLAWPDPEKSYSFMEKIIDDICKCSLYYSDRMRQKISLTKNARKYDEVTEEWCIAVNNIEHIKRSIGIFVDKLIENSVNSTSEDKANYKIKLDSRIDKTIKSLNQEIENILRVVADEMTPYIITFLNEGGSVTQKNNRSLNDLIEYLNKSLCILHENLNEKNFNHVFDIITESTGSSMFNIVDTNSKRIQRCSYFGNLRDIFHILLEFLNYEKETDYKSETTQELFLLLDLYALDTKDLIHQYYLQKLQEQQEMQESTEGVLTVKLSFIENDLIIDILNADRLKTMYSNYISSPFVTVALLPQYRFQNVVYTRTAVQEKTLHPSFNKPFKITLTPEQRNYENGIITFIIEDEVFLGLKYEFMSETFIHFKNIPSIQCETDLNSLPQVKLNMTVPKSLDSNVLKVLDSRTKDKMARDFIKQVKNKIRIQER